MNLFHCCQCGKPYERHVCACGLIVPDYVLNAAQAFLALPDPLEVEVFLHPPANDQQKLLFYEDG